ncbi:MAG TPA: hypothetical protein VGP78_07810, partial [Solirubrobacteraceae bacterium]|nr:hypothetical protein [Solirubrobacteraceae bacterium]
MRRSARLRAAGAAILVLLALGLGLRLGASAAGFDLPFARRPPPAHVPRAFGGPDGRIALDDAWVVRRAAGLRGVAAGWPAGSFGGRRVTIPFSPNARHVTGAAGRRSQAGEVAWFRTSFSVRRGGDYAIRFESVNHRARVWVDGRQVARHTGAYLPFEVRVHLAPGRHV